MFDFGKNGTSVEREAVWQTLPNDDFANIGMPGLVYVKAVKAGDLSEDIGEEMGQSVSPDQTLYAVHAANGTRMAIVDSRGAAFAGAVQYDFMPVSVH